MSDYIIATSSTSDLPRTWLDAHNVPFIPYTYTVNDELHEDDCREDSREAVYLGMREGDRLKTSMINEFVYYDFFERIPFTALRTSAKPSWLCVSAVAAPVRNRTIFF